MKYYNALCDSCSEDEHQFFKMFRGDMPPDPLSFVRASHAHLYYSTFFSGDNPGTFLRECTAEQASPTFFQYITDVIFKEMIKREFPLTSIDGGSNEAPLSYLEKNALRYSAGYVTRNLRKQLQRSAHPNKVENSNYAFWT